MAKRRTPIQVSVEKVIKCAGLLEEYETALKTYSSSFHLRSEVDGFMPLVIEVIYDHFGRKAVSVAHYGELNGDLMADPEIVFVPSMGWNAVQFTNHYVGAYDSTHTEQHVLVLSGLDKVLAKNIRYQGFADSSAKITSLTHQVKAK